MKKPMKIVAIVLGIILGVCLLAGGAFYYLGHNLYSRTKIEVNTVSETEILTDAEITQEKQTESEPLTKESLETESGTEAQESETETAESQTEDETEEAAEVLTEDALSQAMEEETIAAEDAEGKIVTAEEESEMIEELREFASSEPITTDGSVYNVLLIGVDRRDSSWYGNSDTMMLLSINEEAEKLNLISLMRDTYVDIPGIGMRKLNAAHANGGGELLLETVTENYKVQVDRYITVDFSSMIDIVNTIGSITIEMSDAEVKVANGYITDMCNQMDLDASDYLIPGGGEILCDGIQALGYSRIRYVGNADYQRTERQRLVLSKLLEKVKESSLVDLYELANVLVEKVSHNLPEDEFWGLLLEAPKLLKYELVQDRIPYDNMYEVIYVKGQDMLVPDWPETIQRLKATLYGEDAAETEMAETETDTTETETAETEETADMSF